MVIPDGLPFGAIIEVSGRLPSSAVVNDQMMTTGWRRQHEKWGWRALVSSNKSVGSKGAVITHLFVFGDEEEKKWSSWSPLGDWESKRDKRGTNPSTLGHSHSRRTHCCCLSGSSSRFAETVAEEQGRAWKVAGSSVGPRRSSWRAAGTTGYTRAFGGANGPWECQWRTKFLFKFNYVANWRVKWAIV